MNRNSRPQSRHSAGAHAQRGVALLIALILLVVITLVGLAAIGTTILQNRATANQYDRQIAFQSAEAAMRVATAELVAASSSGPPGPPLVSSRSCDVHDTGVDCLANPFNDSNLPAGSIHNVAPGNAATQFTAALNSPMQPQYVIENVGQWKPPAGSSGNTANEINRPGPPKAEWPTYFRITARSCDSTDARCDNRAIVTLQSLVKM